MLYRLWMCPSARMRRLFRNRSFSIDDLRPGRTFVNRAALLPALGIFLLSGCTAPLKAPPIQAATANQPHVDIVPPAELACAASNAYEPASGTEAAYRLDNVLSG